MEAKDIIEQTNNKDSESILEILEASSIQLVATCHHPNVYFAEDLEEND
jgi:ferredoxin